MTTYVKHLSEPWFTMIKTGKKVCEGRVKQGDFAKMKVGDTIVFKQEEEQMVIIESITEYDLFHTYLEKEGLQDCLPGVATMNEGVGVYRKYYSIEEEQKNGVIAIRFSKKI